ncbi:lysine-rich arabinogalactan protein 18-like [Alosa sapidissima]|uniref:lysine-rich arabinogalactan protein 18-like n=1 Tax=Alosa sapidissima TaxID=34773 RepID=UPI001C09E748|nr:lysine-rich arabinogalactan protein 18-like [Alosa sapidissima]
MARPRSMTLEEIHAFLDVESDFNFEEIGDSGSESGSVDSEVEDAFAEGMDVLLDFAEPSAPLPRSLTSSDPLEGTSATAPPVRPPASTPIATPGTSATGPSASTSAPQHRARGPAPAPASTPCPPAARCSARCGKRPVPASTPCPPAARRDKRPAPASTPCPPTAKRGARHGKRPAQAPVESDPPVDMWHDADWEDVEPPPFKFCPKRTPDPLFSNTSTFPLKDISLVSIQYLAFGEVRILLIG